MLTQTLYDAIAKAGATTPAEVEQVRDRLFLLMLAKAGELDRASLDAPRGSRQRQQARMAGFWLRDMAFRRVVNDIRTDNPAFLSAERDLTETMLA